MKELTNKDIVLEYWQITIDGKNSVHLVSEEMTACGRYLNDRLLGNDTEEFDACPQKLDNINTITCPDCLRNMAIVTKYSETKCPYCINGLRDNIFDPKIKYKCPNCNGSGVIK